MIDFCEVLFVYYKNIEVEIEDEISNVEVVFCSMDELMKMFMVVVGVVMFDVCLIGGKGCIFVGGVVVIENVIYFVMYSVDICCLVMMIFFGYIDFKKVLDMAYCIIYFGGGGCILGGFEFFFEFID